MARFDTALQAVGCQGLHGIPKDRRAGDILARIENRFAGRPAPARFEKLSSQERYRVLAGKLLLQPTLNDVI